jgi:hypothetical protein
MIIENGRIEARVDLHLYDPGHKMRNELAEALNDRSSRFGWVSGLAALGHPMTPD